MSGLKELAGGMIASRYAKVPAIRDNTDPFSTSTIECIDIDNMSPRTAVGVDVGGTFTDAILVQRGDSPVAVKVPSTDQPHRGVIQAIEQACEQSGVEPETIDVFRHGSTVATNALLERRGADTALVTTAGFRDVLEIGRQDRTVMYDLAAHRPDPLIPREDRYELTERTPPPAHHDPGAVRVEIDGDELAELIDELDSYEAVAVCFLHSDIDPTHEKLVADRLSSELDAPVIVSSDIDPTVREYERAATTTASAYLTPLLKDYLDRLIEDATAIGLPTPHVMQSNGGVVTPPRLISRAVAGVLSGPAAGVVGGMNAVSSTQSTDVGYITLDMGGTSADVSLIEGDEPTRTTETRIDSIPIRVPALDIHTVGAGGGSIAWVDKGGALRVGPRSAGAAPGPVCYGKGGMEPTVTDAAAVLGIIGADRVFGRGLELDIDAAETSLAALADSAGLADAQTAAAGTVRIATETMAQAIRHITVERGHDPRAYTLIAFGGAGGMFATGIADRLGIGQIATPPMAGLLSAVGLVTADERHDAATGVHEPLGDGQSLEQYFDQLETSARRRCTQPEMATVRRFADLRYVGQSYELQVPVDDPVDVDTLQSRYHETHRRRRGYTLDDEITVIACRVQAIVSAEFNWKGDSEPGGELVGSREVQLPDESITEFQVFDGQPQAGLDAGPMLIEREHDTVVIPPGWRLEKSAPVPVIERAGDR